MENELRQLADEILTEMYAEAEPPLDFMYLRENPDEAPDGWYKQHHLPKVEQNAIFDKHVDRFEEDVRSLSASEHTALVTECILNLGPATSPQEEQ
jgi:hypothetical protein